ncbi:6-phospho-beta-glucosidase [Thermohalobacter berrensis]|uniref:6-phospho-beta-glucosidase n=1 Tax=Thermohalobacter berrensis TaxID=99594 RepID=A0A419T4H2_9FIRM|nr:6-phospho-beta-glucosidase [Thermohalobacter berrensis]RKD32362.1 6-phospho-beta-glucosidase [Thermohalobacter berrensis]
MTKKGLKIATIGGGSSYTPEIIEGFINRHHELPVKEIWLVDIEEGREKLEIVGNLAKRMVEKAGVDCEIKLTLDRREALKDADFVTTQFRVGLLDARIRDEKIPLRYNCIGQETTGAGGFAKALRTIPVILDICKDMEELCPDAWLVNFTNPSGIITETVLKHTNIKVVGLCNVPILMHMIAAQVLEADKDDVLVHFAGLNHLVWGRKIYYKGKDVTRKVVEKLADGVNFTAKNIPDMGWVKEHLLDLNMLPCPYHRYFYLTDKMLKEEIEAAKTEGTRGEVVKKVEAELFELYKDPNLAEKPKQLEQRGGQYYSDAACELINAIYNDKRIIMPVNVQNNGAISDLPEDVAVETSCVITKHGPMPLNTGHVETKIRGLMQVVKAYEEMTVEAAVTGDYNRALQALTMNPLVTDSEIAKKMLDDIIRENIEYLPQFKKYYEENLK